MTAKKSPKASAPVRRRTKSDAVAPEADLADLTDAHVGDPAGEPKGPASRAGTALGHAAADDAETVADEVFEFVRAIDHYKRAHGRPFPSWSEVLEILKGLGYERR